MGKPCSKRKNYKMYNEDLYKVDHIVKVRWVKNRQICLVKWKGYDDSHNTWEPREHIISTYLNEDSQDDDLEYSKHLPISSTPHQYHTRTKKTKPISSQHPHKLDICQSDEQPECPSEPQPMTPTRSVKKIQHQTTCEEQLEIGKKEGRSQSLFIDKDSLVMKVITLGWNESKLKRMALVETNDKRVITMEEDLLKKYYPRKLIQYYQEQCRAKSAKYY